MSKPYKWPANFHEEILEKIYIKVNEFIEDPSYKTKEVLLSLICEHDLNQHTMKGLIRVTEYEVKIINNLYFIGTIHQINSLKVFLYKLISENIYLQKIKSLYPFTMNIKNRETMRIKEYEEGLELSLRLYYFAFQKFVIEKEKNFSEQLISVINEILLDITKEEEFYIGKAYLSLLHDLSNMYGSKKESIWEFTREELLELFSLEARILKKINKSPIVRPIKGVLKMQISNFILKSRHNYNNAFICKYLPKEVAKESINNHQIWMKKTELLNDEREQKVIPEFFKDTSWIRYKWIKDIDFTPIRTYYVSCFSKALNTDKMQNSYGQCLYGYKNDRIAELIAPINIMSLEETKAVEKDSLNQARIPVFAQVIAFDVLYDEREAREELEYLFDVIDMFDMNDSDKKQFLQEILQYWILSVKDGKWCEEKERRYVLFLYDNYEYKEVEIDKTFLKVKTSLFLTPDFIIGDNPGRFKIEKYLKTKRTFMFNRQYLFCADCLMQDYDVSFTSMPKVCPICGSSKVKKISYR